MIVLAFVQSRAPPPDFDAEAEIANASKMRIKELQTALGKMGVSTRGLLEKTELVDAYVGALRDGKRPDAPANGDDKMDGAAVDQARGDGAMPLSIACFDGHVDAVKQLLDKGAAADRAVSEGYYEGATPLDVAKHKGHSAVVALLKKHSRSSGVCMVC